MSVKNSVRNFGMANGGARCTSDSFSQASDWLKPKKAEIARGSAEKYLKLLREYFEKVKKSCFRLLLTNNNFFSFLSLLNIIIYYIKYNNHL